MSACHFAITSQNTQGAPICFCVAPLRIDCAESMVERAAPAPYGRNQMRTITHVTQPPHRPLATIATAVPGEVCPQHGGVIH